MICAPDQYSWKQSLHSDFAPTYFPWKGKTLPQITSLYHANTALNTDGNDSQARIFKPQPLKHYRREILTVTQSTGTSSRTSLSIRQNFEQPGGTHFNSVATETLCNAAVVDPQEIGQTQNLYDRGLPVINCVDTSSTLTNNSLSQEFNAKRRVRSGGMIPRKFNPVDNDQYMTSTQQYLHSRKKTFQQNTFVFASDPGSNVDPCGNAPAPVFKPNNSQFSQQGAVTASERLLRLKVETIDSVANSYKGIYGAQTANALCYGVAQAGYAQNLKNNVLGFPDGCLRNSCQLPGSIR